MKRLQNGFFIFTIYFTAKSVKTPGDHSYGDYFTRGLLNGNIPPNVPFSCTHSHVAHELLVAHGLVGFVYGGGTSGRHAVTIAGVAATVVVATQIADFQIALVRTARSLCTAWKFPSCLTRA